MKGLPTEADWDHARALLPFLKAVYESSLKMSGSFYVSTHDYFHAVFDIRMKINDKMEDPKPSVKLMASKMKEKFYKYWGNIESFNPLFFISVILDLRYEIDYTNFEIEEIYEAEKAVELCFTVKKTLIVLFEHYCLVTGICNKEPNVPEENEGLADSVDYPISKYKTKREETQFNEGKSELDMYLEDNTVEDDKNFNVLAWWKMNRTTYLILALVAQDVLVIPVPTVTSESAFRIGEHVLDPFRSTLTPKIVERLECAHDWLRSLRILVENEEKFEDLEGIETDFKDLVLNETMMVIDD